MRTADHRPRHTTSGAIPGLAGSATHELGIEIYQAHQAVGNGTCAQCGRPHPCRSWRGAAELIAAAGEDPRRYNPRYVPTSHPQAEPWHAAEPSATTILPIGPAEQTPDYRNNGYTPR